MDKEVRPNPEPAREPFDAHMMPLDDEDDAQFLDPKDPRRIEIENKRGHGFGHRIRERLHRDD
jgi:hypothetical protein